MKYLILSFFFFSVVQFSFAQDSAGGSDMAIYPLGGESEFGVGANYNASFLTEDGFSSLDGYKSQPGYSASVQYEYYFSHNWGIKTKLNIDYKGLATDTDPAMEADLLYLTLPVMASWHFGKKRRWYLHFGAYAGALLFAELEGTDIKEFVNSTDFGTDFGIGVRIPAGDKWFFIETDGQNSFGSPFKSNALQPDAQLARTTLGVGIIF